MKKALIILAVIIVHCTLLIDNCVCQWVAQTLPASGQIDDMAFLNKDTGFIAMGSINTLMRTLNGGTNWDIIRDFRIYQLEKINTRTLYAINYDGNKLYRTYDGGISWDSITAGGWCGISFINKDTGWASSWSGIYKTTNAGLSYNFLSSTVNCGKIIFLKENYSGEYCGFLISSGALFKSTNSGLNWVNVQNTLGAGTYSSISFINKDTGWCYFDYNIKPHEILFTSNGGSNWVIQYVDSTNSFSQIHFENRNKGWAGPTHVSYRIFATSNGGNTWGTQVLPFFYDAGPYQNSFIDSLVGWIGLDGNTIAKTTNGGGPVIYPTYIDSNSTIIPSEYVLKQNYPNPFNPSTTIEFSLPKESYVKLKILDLSGKTVLWIVYDMLLYSGLHKFKIVDFEKLKLSSGVYFYQMEARDINNQQLNFFQSRKMILLK